MNRTWFWCASLASAWLACDKPAKPVDEHSEVHPPPGTLSPPPTEARLDFQTWQLSGTDRTSDFAFVPGTAEELLVLDHKGIVLHFELTPSGRVIERGEVRLPDVYYKNGCGLLGLAFDPEFETNRFVYFAYCAGDATTNLLTRHRLRDDVSSLADESVTILKIETYETDEHWHRFGSLGFDPDGTMWALMGDNFIDANGQDTHTRRGSLLRFIPNRQPDGEGHSPAPDNPFFGDPDKNALIYSYGLRSPWRGYRDRYGRYWIGDVGHLKVEEINLVTEPAQNFGWADWEGPCAQDCDGLRDPLIHWGRSSDEPFVLDDPDTEPAVKRCAWLGVMYEQFAEDRYYGLLDDMVLYGDFYTGWVRGVRVDETGAIVEDRLVAHKPSLTAWRVGSDGYLYATTLEGELHRAVIRP